MNDDWRYKYVGEDTWLLDLLLNHNPEDKIIAGLDGIKIPPERISGIKMIANLDERKRRIVYKYLWEGKSFASIGEDEGFSKQRAHQIYQSAIADLSVIYPDLDSILTD